jgi:hypothetical protein
LALLQAAQYPEKLQELIFRWNVEAFRNNVFPLGGTGSINPADRPSVLAGRKSITFYKGQQKVDNQLCRA